MTQTELEELKNLLLSFVPSDGTSVGNVTLMGKLRAEAKSQLSFDLKDDDYWEVRNALIDEGLIDKGRGRGGSVYRVQVSTQGSRAPETKIRETHLYDAVRQYIEKTWVKDNGISQCVVEKTAAQGRRNTGGKWTRPDFAVVGLKTFTYTPEKVFELITFEVKPADDYRIEGVFETLAHSRFSNRAYLMIHIPNGIPATENFKRVERECERLGLGLIVFTDHENWNTYETLQEPERRIPDPADVNSFITTQLSKQSQTRVLAMIK